MSVFRITAGKGIHIIFDNGWAISIQIGAGNYCDNYDNDIMQECMRPASKIDLKSETAEIAIWDNNGKWMDFGSDTVKGYVPINEVLEWIDKISKKEPVLKSEARSETNAK